MPGSLLSLERHASTRTHTNAPGRCAKSGHEVEEQRWLVNGDRSPLAAFGSPPGSKTIGDPATAEATIDLNGSPVWAIAALEIKIHHTGDSYRRQKGRGS
ncbi:hypothetical protein [Mesorhizobium sophorae]|uniref:hypothetical protein n=1 Tax=Mesorhizobium sophorae TaxID=1300294 RepID=UPI00117D61B1|nr:hypothetical protein [Mesorhizobium sophorae]